MREQTTQEQFWRGEFGNEYIKPFFFSELIILRLYMFSLKVATIFGFFHPLFQLSLVQNETLR